MQATIGAMVLLGGLWVSAAAVAGPVGDGAVDSQNTLRWPADDRGDWYEWWYYKVVPPSSTDAFYFVYGVVNPWDGSGTRAGSESQLGFGSFADHALIDQRLPVSAFSASRTEMSVTIADSTATDRNLVGELVAADGGKVSWNLTMSKRWSFDAMGWAGQMPNVSDIYWYPAQASAEMSGTVDYEGRQVVLDHAPAYQDRNWGRKFPEWWTWLAANEFEGSPGTALAAGGGVTRVILGDHQVLSVGLLHEGQTYAFRPSEGAVIDADIAFGTWRLTATSLAGYRIEIVGTAPREAFLDIPFHSPDGATFHDYEALRGHLEVKLFTRHLVLGWQQIAELTTDAGGIEYGSPEAQGTGQEPTLARRSLSLGH